MAESVLFEVDASQILAKLHLAGIQSIKIENGEFLVNTGILNDNANAKPDSPGDIKFDLTNKTGEYQVGYATQIEYRKAFGLEDAIDAIADLLAKTSGDKSKILDDLKSHKDDYAKFNDAKKRVLDIFSAYGEKIPNKQMNDPDSIKELREKAKQLISRDAKMYEDTLDEAKQSCVSKISAYLKAFAGADNVDAVDTTKLGMVDISSRASDSNAKGLVSMYEIQPMPDQEKEKMVAQFRADFEKNPKQNNCKQKVCFYVKYTLNVDK